MGVAIRGLFVCAILVRWGYNGSFDEGGSPKGVRQGRGCGAVQGRRLTAGRSESPESVVVPRRGCGGHQRRGRKPLTV